MQAEQTYCYSPEVIDGFEKVDILPVAGAVVIIDTRNYHAVERLFDSRTYGNFISFFPSERLRLWS